MMPSEKADHGLYFRKGTSVMEKYFVLWKREKKD
jgi:hypothetical protein